MYQPQFKAVYIIIIITILLLLCASKIVLLVFLLFFYGEMFELMFSCKNDWEKNYSLEEDDDLEDYSYYDVSMLYITDEVVSQWEPYEMEIDEEDEDGQLKGMEALDYELDWDHPSINVPKKIAWMEAENEIHLNFCFDLYIDRTLIKSNYKFNRLEPDLKHLVGLSSVVRNPKVL